MDTYYVIQMKLHPWDDKHWDTLDGRHYRTVVEARAALEQKPVKSMYRIAEAYAVIRYKAVG